jgi:hypothetical protein
MMMIYKEIRDSITGLVGDRQRALLVIVCIVWSVLLA